MESLSSLSAQSSITPPPIQIQDAYQNADALVIASAADNGPAVDDSTSVNFQDLYKGLSLTSKQIVDKINELLKAKLPDGIQSLTPEQVTPDATADRIVSGITSLFDAFAKQHKDLQGEDLVKAFMEQARSGVQTGYDSASKTLQDIGAFDVSGVKDGIEQTKILIEEKLGRFEAAKTEELKGNSVQAITQIDTAQNLIAQAGGKTLSVLA